MKLRDHAQEIKGHHLRDLLQDPVRCASLSAEYNGLILDYSRQNVTANTMVTFLLFLPLLPSFSSCYYYYYYSCHSNLLFSLL